MDYAISETSRRRAIQLKYHEDNNITPESIRKSRREILNATSIADIYRASESESEITEDMTGTPEEIVMLLERKMLEAAERLDFETAAKYRDAMRKGTF